VAFGRTRTLRARPEPLFGESVELKIEARSRRRAANAERTIRAQLHRLGALFDENDPLPAERLALTTVIDDWSAKTSGALNGARGADTRALGLGWVVDRAIERVAQLRPAVDAITLAVGPCVVHYGSGSATTSVGDPPVRIELAGSAVATSVAAGDKGASGRASLTASASVVAADALTATALARTLTSVHEPAPVIDTLVGASAWMAIDADGTADANDTWQALVRGRPTSTP